MVKVHDIYGLKYEHEKRNPGSHFFDADTLKFFGERLSSMRLLQKLSKVRDFSDVEHECYCISSPQKTPLGNRMTHYFYFDTETMEEVIPA